MVNEDIFQERWKMAFPREELETRMICGDPRAVAWSQIERWVEAQGFKPSVSMLDLVHCLWYEKYGDHSNKYDIYRFVEGKSMSLPGDLPRELDKAIIALFS